MLMLLKVSQTDAVTRNVIHQQRLSINIITVGMKNLVKKPNKDFKHGKFDHYHQAYTTGIRDRATRRNMPSKTKIFKLV